MSTAKEKLIGRINSSNFLNSDLKDVLLDITNTTMTPKEGGFDIILNIGQSNNMFGGNETDGTGGGVSDEEVTDPRIKQYKTSTGEIVLAQEPLEHPDKQTGEIGYAFNFARRYIREGYLENGREVLIIPAAVGATGFAGGDWNKGGARYNNAVTYINNVLADETGNHRVVAILWHQGEADTAMVDSNYTTALDQMIDDLRSDINYNMDSVPFILGEMVPYWVRDGDVENHQGVITDTVNRKPYTAIAKSSYPTEIIKSSPTVDVVHYSAAGQRELTKRYWEAFVESFTNKIVDSNVVKKDVLKNEVLRITFNSNGPVVRTGILESNDITNLDTNTTTYENDTDRGFVLNISTSEAGGLKLSTKFQMPKSYTRSAWLKTTNISGSNNNILSEFTAGGQTPFWINDVSLKAGIQGLGFSALAKNYSQKNNKWTHVATTWCSQKKRAALYIDGCCVDVLNNNSAEDPDFDNVEFVIGGYGPSTNRLIGRIDDIRVFDRELKPEEITDLCNRTKV